MEKKRTTRRRRKDARPEEILSAALDEFADKGFGHSTLAGIAARAGISRTTIYLYYDTKEAILEAVIRNSVEAAIDDVASLVAVARGDFRSLFTRAIDIIYDRLLQGNAAVFFKILVAEGHVMPDLVGFYRREILSKGEQVIAALIERGIASGDLSPSCRDEDVRVFVAPAIFAALWKQVFDAVDPLNVTRFKDAHVRLVTDALLSRR